MGVGEEAAAVRAADPLLSRFSKRFSKRSPFSAGNAFFVPFCRNQDLQDSRIFRIFFSALLVS